MDSEHKRAKTEQEQLPLTRQVHAARCEADPVYQLLMDPSAPLETPDGPVAFVDRLLTGCVDMLRRRYGQKLEGSRYVRVSHERLCDPRTNVRIKQFALLFMLCREPSIQQLFSSMYPAPDSELGDRGLHSEQAAAVQFQRLLAALDGVVETTFNYPFGQGNVKGIVDGVLLYATRVYFMGKI